MAGSGGEIDGEKRIKEVAPQLIQDEGKQRQQDIGGGAGQGGENHALLTFLKLRVVTGTGLAQPKPVKSMSTEPMRLRCGRGIEG